MHSGSISNFFPYPVQLPGPRHFAHSGGKKKNARPSITDISSRRCPLLHLLPWLDTSCATVIGPRSYGLCWWSQRVRKAGGRVVPVHHPVKDSLPRRSFVEQRAHIVAARASTLRPRQAVPVRAPSSAKRPRSGAVSRVNVESLPFGCFLWWFFCVIFRHGEPCRLCMVSRTHVSLFPRMHRRHGLEVL